MLLLRGRILSFGGAILTLGLVLMLVTSPGFASADEKNDQLFQAVEKGLLEQVKGLLESGADVNALDKQGQTPLDIARRYGHKEAGAFLRAYGGETAEGLRISEFGDRVARRGAELFFRLRDGRIRSERDAPVYPAAEVTGYSDATGAPHLNYEFTELIDPWYVIHMQYYEGEGMEFINQATGAVTGVSGAGPFSPDKKRFLSIGFPGESNCETAIWKLSNKGVTREWGVEGYCHYSYQWANPSSVEVCDGPGKVVRLRRDGGTWRCEGSPEMCRNGAFLPAPEGFVDVELSDQKVTPLMKAAAAGDVEAIHALLDGGSDVNEVIEHQGTALETAAEAGHLESVRVLLERGANVNAEGRNRWPAIIWAASQRTWDVVKFLLDRGAEMHAEFGWLALMKAAGDGHRELVTELLDRGVPINPEKGPTALMFAAGEGRIKTVELLLKKGAEVNAKDEHGRTALMLAAIRKHAEIVGLLLDKGASGNAQDEDGYTALMDAAWGGNPEVVRILLDKRADSDAKNRRGETALKIAWVCGHKEIEDLLDAR